MRGFLDKVGGFIPINRLGGRHDKQPAPQIHPPPPKRRRTPADDDGDDESVRMVPAPTSTQGQRSQIRSQQHLRNRASEASLDVLIQSPSDYNSNRTARQPSVTAVSSSHKSGAGNSRNNMTRNQPELRQAEQFATTPKSGRRRRRRSQFPGSIARPANMKSPSPSDDLDGESESPLIVDDDDIPVKKPAMPVPINTNVAVILSNGRINNASKRRFRDKMMMPPQRQNGSHTIYGTKHRLDSDSGDELSEEFFVESSAKTQQQQQQSRNAVVEILDLQPPRKRQNTQTFAGRLSSSSPKAAKASSFSVSTKRGSASVPMMAEGIRSSPLSVDSAFRQPDSFFLSDTKSGPLSLTIHDQDPDVLVVPAEQVRVRAQKMQWLGVDLARARGITFHTSSPIVLFSFPQSNGFGSMLGIKFTSVQDARQLVAWVMESHVAQGIKRTEAPSPNLQRRKFGRCLTEVLEFRDRAAVDAESEADTVRDSTTTTPVANKSPLPVTSDLVRVRRARSSRNLNGAKEPIDLEGSSKASATDSRAGSSPVAANGAVGDRAMRLRSRAARGQGTTRQLVQDMEFERWTTKNPDWAKDWRIPLTYARTTVDKDDVARLDEGEFLNDNIINFYMQFLQDTLKKSESSIAKRVYFHNTFFYEKLRPSKGREIAFEGVKRWTAKADLFSYDYIIVPVNEHAHWWLAIICNVPKILAAALPETDDKQAVDKAETVPQTLEAAEPIDVESHRPQSVVVDDDDDGTKNDGDVELVSIAAKKKTSPSRLNGQKQDMPIDVDDAGTPNRKPKDVKEIGKAEEAKEPTILDSVETDKVEDKDKDETKTPTPVPIEVPDEVPGDERKTKATENASDKASETKDKDAAAGKDNDDDEVTEVKRESVQASTPKPTSAKKGFRGAVKNKKVFIPPGKKQDPADPRIFTLDSLGSVHTASVDHLKQWLMAEIAEREGVVPKDPGRLGMTAKAIPQQENFCDCGVYLLLYLQEFVKDPDSFIEDIVLRQERSWDTSAPDMRKQLRDLILHMQKEYQAAEESNRKPKKKMTNSAGDKRFVLAEPPHPPTLSSPPAETETVVDPTPASASPSGADVPIPSSEVEQQDGQQNDQQNGQQAGHDEASRSSAASVEAGCSSPFPSKSASPDVFKRHP